MNVFGNCWVQIVYLLFKLYVHFQLRKLCQFYKMSDGFFKFEVADMVARVRNISENCLVNANQFCAPFFGLDWKIPGSITVWKVHIFHNSKCLQRLRFTKTITRCLKITEKVAFNFDEFLKQIKTCGQTVLPDGSLKKKQKLVENTKNQTYGCDFFTVKQCFQIGHFL